MTIKTGEQGQDALDYIERRTTRLYYWLKAARKDPTVKQDEYASVAREYAALMRRLANEIARRDRNVPSHSNSLS